MSCPRVYRLSSYLFLLFLTFLKNIRRSIATSLIRWGRASFPRVCFQNFWKLPAFGKIVRCTDFVSLTDIFPFLIIRRENIDVVTFYFAYGCKRRTISPVAISLPFRLFSFEIRERKIVFLLLVVIIIPGWILVRLIRQQGRASMRSIFLSFFLFLHRDPSNEYFSRAVCEVSIRPWIGGERKEEMKKKKKKEGEVFVLVEPTEEKKNHFPFHWLRFWFSSFFCLSSTTWPKPFYAPALPIRSPPCCRFTSCRTNQLYYTVINVNANVRLTTKADF